MLSVIIMLSPRLFKMKVLVYTRQLGYEERDNVPLNFSVSRNTAQREI